MKSKFLKLKLLSNYTFYMKKKLLYFEFNEKKNTSFSFLVEITELYFPKYIEKRFGGYLYVYTFKLLSKVIKYIQNVQIFFKFRRKTYQLLL